MRPNYRRDPVERARRYQGMLWEAKCEAPTGVYIPAWERAPVDPRVEHVITIDSRSKSPTHRVTCSCGLDRGWQSRLAPTQDAEIHRNRIEKLKAEQNVDDVPVPVIERRQCPGGAPEFRWYCGPYSACGKAPWLPSEQVAIVGAILHADACVHRKNRANAATRKNGGRHV
jgi:hypothetical protein